MRAYSFAQERGDEFEREFEQTVRPIVEANKWLFISNIHIPSRSGYNQTDFLIFTPYGYFCVETKNWFCKIECKDTCFWHVIYPNKSYNTFSPMIQTKAHITALSRHIPIDRLYGIVCFCDSAEIINRPSGVMYLSEFVEWISTVNKRFPVTIQYDDMIKDFIKIMQVSSECMLKEMENTDK